MPASTEQMVWLREQCNALLLGRCFTSACMKRGGYRAGMSPGERKAVKATCIPLELYRLLDGTR